MTALRKLLSAFAEDHGRKTVDECEVLLLRQDSALPKQAEKIPRVSTRGASFSFFIIVVAIFLFSPRVVFAQNLLTNGDFETGSSEFWSSSGGGATATVSAELVYSGSYALKIQHDKTSSYGFQQAVKDLEGGMFYELSGYGATNDSQVGNYFLRVAWYESNDGSGSQLTLPNDSGKATETNGQWQEFKMVIQAPLSARSAKVRLVLTSKTSGVLATAFFDDLAFQESVAPTPTPTPEPTNIPTPTPSPTPKPSTSTPTPKLPTSTPTQKILTPTPSQKISPTPTPKKSNQTATASGEVLGEEVSTISAFYPYEATDEAEKNEATPSARNKILPKIFLIGGLLLLFVSACWLWYNFRRN